MSIQPQASESKASSVGRLEALEADIAVLKAERALDILTSTLGRWIDQFYVAEKPSVSASSDETRPIPDSFKEDVSRALADLPSASTLLQAPNLWPALQDIYNEVIQERQRKLQQTLSMVNTIMREAKSQEKRLLKKKNAAKNSKNPPTTSPVENEQKPETYQATDFHPAHCAASNEGAVVQISENTGPEVDLAKEATKEREGSYVPILPPSTVVSLDPPVARDGELPEVQPTATVSNTGSQKPAASKRGRKRPLTAAQPKKVTSRAVKIGGGVGKSQDMRRSDDFVIPADPLSAIMHSIVPAYRSDDEHKIFGEVHGFDRRRIPQIESDSGVATRPRRSRKTRKMPKAP